MAIIKVVKKNGKTKASLKSAVEYIGEKACNTFGINCGNDYHQIVNNFYETKEYFNKLVGRQYRHYIQSFAPNEISKNEINGLKKFLKVMKFLLQFMMIESIYMLIL